MERLINWINQNPGKAVGAALGFIVGVLILVIGWGTIIVVLLTIAGYVAGKLKDDNGNISGGIGGIFGKKE